MTTAPGRTGRAGAFGRALARSFYRPDPREVAPQLLNKLLVLGEGFFNGRNPPHWFLHGVFA